MKNKINYLLLCLAFIVFNCETDEAVESELSNFVGFEISSEPFRFATVAADATGAIEINVYASEISSADRSFGIFTSEDLHEELIVDRFGQTAFDNNAYPYLEADFNLPSEVVIPAGSNKGTLMLNVTDDDDLGFVNQYLPISFVSEAGKDFAVPIILGITEQCLDTIATFTLTLDTWPDETTWEIFDLNGTPTVIFSGGPYANPADDFAVLSFDFCLAPGEYGVVVYDSYGDGITDGGYEISVGGNVLVSGVVAGPQSTAEFSID